MYPLKVPNIILTSITLEGKWRKEMKQKISDGIFTTAFASVSIKRCCHTGLEFKASLTDMPKDC